MEKAANLLREEPKEYLGLLAFPEARKHAAVVKQLLLDEQSQWLAEAVVHTLEEMFGDGVADQLCPVPPEMPARAKHAVMGALNGLNDRRTLDVALMLITESDEVQFSSWGNTYSPKWRNDAVSMIGKWGDSSLAGRFIPLLHQSTWNIRISAIRALALIHAQAQKKQIAEMLSAMQPFEVRMEAVMALTAMDAREYAASIGDLLKEDDDPFSKQGVYRIDDFPPYFYNHLGYSRWSSEKERYYIAIFRALEVFDAHQEFHRVVSLLKRELPPHVALEGVKTLLRRNLISIQQGIGFIAADLRARDHLSSSSAELDFLSKNGAIEQVDLWLKFVSEHGDYFKRPDIEMQTGFVESPALIDPFLDSADEELRMGALLTLQKIGAVEFAPHVAAMLAPEMSEPERIAALGFLKQFHNPEAGALVAVHLLHDPIWKWRSDGLKLLATVKARAQASAVLPFIADPNSTVRLDALSTLAIIGSRDQIVEVGALLKHDDPEMRIGALKTLSALKALDFRDQIMAMLGDPVSEVRLAAREAVKMLWGELPAQAFPVLMEKALSRSDHAGAWPSVDWWFGDRQPFKTALPWLTAEDDSAPATPHESAEGVRIVESLKEIWRLSNNVRCPRTADKAARAAVGLVGTIVWSAHDAPWLEDVADDLSRYPDLTRQAANVRAVAAVQRDRAPARVALRWCGYLAAGLASLWAMILLLYPWTAAARWMIWNRWARRISGMSLPLTILLRMPGYRSRLWTPFRESLLPPEELQTFDEWSFFDSIRMAPLSEGAEGSLPVLTVLRNLSGIWVLQGASGLGKTTLLQCLSAESPFPAAFVRASTCQEGLVETLRRRLPRHAQGDAAFLEKLIRSGALLVMVDAVHEAAIPVQERLVQEVESLSGGKFLLTTQPVVRIAPKGATVCEVLPLRPEDTQNFLVRQGDAAIEAMHSESLPVKREAFAERVRAFMEDLRAMPEADPRSRAIWRMLSNPMDAVFAAEALAAGETPQPDRLLAQRAGQVKTDYESATGEPFPEVDFATHLCASRLAGVPSLNMDEFEEVAASLARHRLLRKGSGGDAGWRFRHDRIMDWFVLPAFCIGAGSSDFLMQDPRFLAARELRRFEAAPAH